MQHTIEFKGLRLTATVEETPQHKWRLLLTARTPELVAHRDVLKELVREWSSKLLGMIFGPMAANTICGYIPTTVPATRYEASWAAGMIAIRYDAETTQLGFCGLDRDQAIGYITPYLTSK